MTIAPKSATTRTPTHVRRRALVHELAGGHRNPHSTGDRCDEQPGVAAWTGVRSGKGDEEACRRQERSAEHGQARGSAPQQLRDVVHRILFAAQQLLAPARASLRRPPRHHEQGRDRDGDERESEQPQELCPQRRIAREPALCDGSQVGGVRHRDGEQGNHASADDLDDRERWIDGFVPPPEASHPGEHGDDRNEQHRERRDRVVRVHLPRSLRTNAVQLRADPDEESEADHSNEGGGRRIQHRPGGSVTSLRRIDRVCRFVMLPGTRRCCVSMTSPTSAKRAG